MNRGKCVYRYTAKQIKAYIINHLLSSEVLGGNINFDSSSNAHKLPRREEGREV